MSNHRDDDDEQGLVLLFPENFPAWALSPEDRRARLRVVEEHHDDDAPAAADDRDE